MFHALWEFTLAIQLRYCSSLHVIGKGYFKRDCATMGVGVLTTSCWASAMFHLRGIDKPTLKIELSDLQADVTWHEGDWDNTDSRFLAFTCVAVNLSCSVVDYPPQRNFSSVQEDGWQGHELFGFACPFHICEEPCIVWLLNCTISRSQQTCQFCARCFTKRPQVADVDAGVQAS